MTLGALASAPTGPQRTAGREQDRIARGMSPEEYYGRVGGIAPVSRDTSYVAPKLAAPMQDYDVPQFVGDKPNDYQARYTQQLGQSLDEAEWENTAPIANTRGDRPLRAGEGISYSHYTGKQQSPDAYEPMDPGAFGYGNEKDLAAKIAEANALRGQVGTGPVSDAITSAALGRAPSAAQEMLNQAMGQQMLNEMAVAGSTQGGPMERMAAQLQAQQNVGRMGSQLSSGLATLRAQEMAEARGQALGLEDMRMRGQLGLMGFREGMQNQADANKMAYQGKNADLQFAWKQWEAARSDAEKHRWMDLIVKLGGAAIGATGTLGAAFASGGSKAPDPTIGAQVGAGVGAGLGSAMNNTGSGYGDSTGYLNRPYYGR